MTEHGTVRVTAADVRVAGSVCGQWVHPVVRRPDTGQLLMHAPCGALAFTMAELRAQLTAVPPLHVRTWCADPRCAPLWMLLLSARRAA